MYTSSGIVVAALIAAVVASAGMAVWPWSRARGRFLVGGIATAIGFVLWRLVLFSANATNLDVDGPVLGLSFEDVGSGVMAFALMTAVLGAGRERSEPAGRVVAAAAIGGVLAILADRFL
jgi:hypothetical protein